MMQSFMEKFIEGIVGGIPNLITALLILLGSLYLARFLSNIVRRVLNTRSAPAGVTNLLAQLTLWTIVIAGTITALQRFFNVTAFLTKELSGNSALCEAASALSEQIRAENGVQAAVHLIEETFG